MFVARDDDTKRKVMREKLDMYMHKVDVDFSTLPHVPRRTYGSQGGSAWAVRPAE